MQIIIDIPDNYYKIIKHDVEHGNDFVPYRLIAKGIPLDDKLPLKVRGKGYVLYNYEWLKEHIDMEVDIIKGAKI